MVPFPATSCQTVLAMMCSPLNVRSYCASPYERRLLIVYVGSLPTAGGGPEVSGAIRPRLQRRDPRAKVLDPLVSGRRTADAATHYTFQDSHPSQHVWDECGDGRGGGPHLTGVLVLGIG